MSNLELSQECEKENSNEIINYNDYTVGGAGICRRTLNIQKFHLLNRYVKYINSYRRRLGSPWADTI